MSQNIESNLGKIAELEQELLRLKRSFFTGEKRDATVEFPLEALVFKVDSFFLAIEAKKIDEVTPMVLVSPLPKAPKSVRGTVNYRGSLAPVLDLRFALTGALLPLTPEMFLVTVTDGERRFAAVANEILSVKTFTSADQESGKMSAMLPSFIKCFFHYEGSPLALIAPEKLLAAGELEVLRDLLSEITEGQQGNGK